VSGFRIAEVNGAPAAAICAWIEGNGGKSSSLLKANLLMHFFGRDRMFAAEANLKLMEELAMPRQRGALQLESIYVLPSFRGRRLAAQIIEHHLRGARQAGPAVSIAQIILAGTNTDAISSYRRAGFEIIRQRTSNDPRILTLLPAGTKLLMQRLL
jgi:ribosomal protein S18 acetylase RimI-like enzyme